MRIFEDSIDKLNKDPKDLQNIIIGKDLQRSLMILNWRGSSRIFEDLGKDLNG